MIRGYPDDESTSINRRFTTGCTYADNPAAQAFNDLWAEKSVMRRAFEAVRQAFEANLPPDYAKDIAQVRQAVDALATRMDSFEKKACSDDDADGLCARNFVGRSGGNRGGAQGAAASRAGFTEQTTLLEQWVLGARTGVSQNWWTYGMLALGIVSDIDKGLARRLVVIRNPRAEN